MKKRIIAIFILAVIMLCLCACGEKSSVISAEKAQSIALKASSFSSKDVSEIHTHIVTYQNIPSYTIHITVDGIEYEYIIHGTTGEVLYTTDVE